MLPSVSFVKISSPQRQIGDVCCLVFFGLFARALHRIYCLPYSRNSSKLLESSAFKLIDLGPNIMSLVGTAALIGKYCSIQLREAKESHGVIVYGGRTQE